MMPRKSLTNLFVCVTKTSRAFRAAEKMQHGMPDITGQSAQHPSYDSTKTTATNNASNATSTSPATPLSIVSGWLQELEQTESKRWSAIISRLNGRQMKQDK